MHLVDRALAGDTLSVRQSGSGQAQQDPGREARYRQVFLVGDLLQPVQLRAHPVGSLPQRMPRITEPYCAAQAGVSAATDPDRDVAAAVVRVVLPGLADLADQLVGQAPPALEVDAERLELLLRPAHAETEHEPAAAELVEVRRHPRDQQGVPVRRDQHGGSEADRVGDPGEPAERGEGFVERCRVLLGDVGRDGDVVRHHQQVVAETFDGTSPRAEPGGVRTGAEVGDVHSDFHPFRLSIRNGGSEEIPPGKPGVLPWIRRYLDRMTETLDPTDWAILVELQRDGRIPLTELGRRVNLSASAATERLKRLESTGVISGYRADVDLAKVGFPVMAVVRLKYPGNKHGPLHKLLAERTEILECLRTTGDDCYTLKVAAGSMAHLEELVNELTEFGSTTTNLVYSQTQPYRGPQAPPPEL